VWANKRKGERLEVAAVRHVGSESGRCLFVSVEIVPRELHVCLLVSFFVNSIRVEEEEDDGDMMMNMY
jgi:hypothetical protein